jgi:nitrate/nitrite transport system substrate-binding protein
MTGAAERLVDRIVEAAVTRAVVGPGGVLPGLGGSTLLGAIGALFPLTTAKVLAQEARGTLEKKQIRIGFVPVACAAPILIADPMGFYALQGLDVVLVKTPGWALVRDLVLNHRFDAAHMLAPMPLALSLGLGSRPEPMHVAAIGNVNGQAITLHLRHRNRRDPKQWSGMKLGVPFEYSMENLLLRCYLADHGLDPDRDVTIRSVPPSEMVAHLGAGGLDGYLGPEPFNQRAVHDGVGFIHLLSKDLWDGHPCCAVGLPASFVKESPNTFAALFRALAVATAHAQKPENRRDVAEAIAPAAWLDQPVSVVEQVLTGRFADGLGNEHNVPARAGFEAFPWHSMAVWILMQLKRWGYVKQDLDYQAVAEQVFLATDARKRLAELGFPAPERTYARHRILGKVFDLARAEENQKGVPAVRAA